MSLTCCTSGEEVSESDLAKPRLGAGDLGAGGIDSTLGMCGGGFSAAMLPGIAAGATASTCCNPWGKSRL
jgi:hypothetical protein